MEGHTIKSSKPLIVADIELDIINMNFVLFQEGYNNEVKYLPIPKKVQESIADKVKSGVPPNVIIDQLRDNFNFNVEKKNIITRKDVYNISSKCGLLHKYKLHDIDALSVNHQVKNFQENSSNPIIMYKTQGTEYFPLDINDFMLIILTETQREVLKKIGSGKLCIDSTHGTNQYNFNLTTSVIIDEFCEGYPADFCIIRFNEDPFALVIITPLMQQAHSLKSSSDIVFLDSTSACDADNYSITFMLTPCAAGAVPLAIIITKANNTGFQLLKECGINCFGGAVWRWVWDSKSSIPKDKGPMLMNSFQSILYANTIDSSEKFFNDIINNSEFPKWTRYLNEHWYTRHKWCLAKFGKFCKHQCAIYIHFDVISKSFPTVTPKDRYEIAILAQVNVSISPNFFQSFLSINNFSQIDVLNESNTDLLNYSNTNDSDYSQKKDNNVPYNCEIIENKETKEKIISRIIDLIKSKDSMFDSSTEGLNILESCLKKITTERQWQSFLHTAGNSTVALRK
ncbi:hypothetical protein QTP88_008267 [Uroleucon formosanum]